MGLKHKVAAGISVVTMASLVLATIDKEIIKPQEFLAKELVIIEGKVMEENYNGQKEGGLLGIGGGPSEYEFSLPRDSVEDVLESPITVQVKSAYNEDGVWITKESVNTRLQKDTPVTVQAREIAPGIYKALAYQVEPGKIASLDDKLYKQE